MDKIKFITVNVFGSTLRIYKSCNEYAANDGVAPKDVISVIPLNSDNTMLAMFLDSDTHPVKFEDSSRHLMQYLGENHHPHTSVILNCLTAEIVEGIEVFNTDNYVLD